MDISTYIPFIALGLVVVVCLAIVIAPKKHAEAAREQHHALVRTGIYAQTPILVKGRAILEPEQ